MLSKLKKMNWNIFIFVFLYGGTYKHYTKLSYIFTRAYYLQHLCSVTQCNQNICSMA